MLEGAAIGRSRICAGLVTVCWGHFTWFSMAADKWNLHWKNLPLTCLSKFLGQKCFHQQLDTDSFEPRIHQLYCSWSHDGYNSNICIYHCNMMIELNIIGQQECRSADCSSFDCYAAVNVNSVSSWSGVDANSTSNPTSNPEEPNIFSPSIFWRTHTNYAPLIRRIPGYWFFSFLLNSCRVIGCQRVEYKT
jgi:hypothetical protein